MRGHDRVIVVNSIRTDAEHGTNYYANVVGGEEPPSISSSHGIDLVTTLELERMPTLEEMFAEQVFIVNTNKRLIPRGTLLSKMKAISDGNVVLMNVITTINKITIINPKTFK